MTFQPDWDKTGTRIIGSYCGHEYTGIIEHSRVKYGGDVQYRVRLLDMINMGDEINHDWRSIILVDCVDDAGSYQLIEEIV